MIFNSFVFLIFLPIVLILYWIIPLKYRWAMLLAASYYFYLSWNVNLVFLIIFTTMISYISGLLMERTKSTKIKKTLLAFTLISCLGVLAFYKYFNLLSTTLTAIIRLFTIPANDFTLNLILPVGISFYTFQTLSYVIDIYRGNIKSEKHLGYYALFVVYFPQLVAGPIERPENLLPQLKAENKFDSQKASMGLKIVLIGFFKKVVVADYIARVVNITFNNAASANGLMVVISTILFAIQIYCDFSGYTDIAIGVALMMGVSLMKNFNNPYRATSIKDFWARWHISLTSWFKDYLYIPLGGNRCSKWRWLLNIMIVFLVSGMWHGANWTFLLWGALHGAYQIVGILSKQIRTKFCNLLSINSASSLVIMLKQAFTFTLVCFAWIFFRANSISDLSLLLNALFTDWHLYVAYYTWTLETLGITLTSLLIIILSVAVVNTLPKILDEPKCIGYWCKASRYSTYIYIIWTIALIWIASLASGGTSAFIYFQF